MSIHVHVEPELTDQLTEINSSSGMCVVYTFRQLNRQLNDGKFGNIFNTLTLD